MLSVPPARRSVENERHCMHPSFEGNWKRKQVPLRVRPTENGRSTPCLRNKTISCMTKLQFLEKFRQLADNLRRECRPSTVPSLSLRDSHPRSVLFSLFPDLGQPRFRIVQSFGVWPKIGLVGENREEGRGRDESVRVAVTDARPPGHVSLCLTACLPGPTTTCP